MKSDGINKISECSTPANFLDKIKSVDIVTSLQYVELYELLQY